MAQSSIETRVLPYKESLELKNLYGSDYLMSLNPFVWIKGPEVSDKPYIVDMKDILDLNARIPWIPAPTTDDLLKLIFVNKDKVFDIGELDLENMNVTIELYGILKKLTEGEQSQKKQQKTSDKFGAYSGAYQWDGISDRPRLTPTARTIFPNPEMYKINNTRQRSPVEEVTVEALRSVNRASRTNTLTRTFRDTCGQFNVSFEEYFVDMAQSGNDWFAITENCLTHNRTLWHIGAFPRSGGRRMRGTLSDEMLIMTPQRAHTHESALSSSQAHHLITNYYNVRTHQELIDLLDSEVNEDGEIEINNRVYLIDYDSLIEYDENLRNDE